MSLIRALTLVACFALVHHGTKPDHHLATLAAIMVICVVVGSDVADGSR